jgi:hypothetical protein
LALDRSAAKIVLEVRMALKQRVQPWIVWGIGLFCLTQGLRLMFFSDPIGTLTGFGLLLPVPGCCYLGWRDYRRLAKSTAAVALRTPVCQMVEPPAAA